MAARYNPNIQVEVVEQVEQYEDPVFEDVRIVTEWINDEPVDITTTEFNYMVDRNIIEHFCCTDIQVQHVGGSELSRCYDIYAPNKERAREAAEYIFSTWENIGVQKTIHVLVLSEDDPELVKYSFTKDYF